MVVMGEFSPTSSRFQETESLLRDLAALLLSVLASPSLSDPSKRKAKLNPIGLTWLLFGISSLLMLMGFVTVCVGVMMMPIVAMVAMFFSFLAILDTLSVAALFPLLSLCRGRQGSI